MLRFNLPKDLAREERTSGAHRKRVARSPKGSSGLHRRETT